MENSGMRKMYLIECGRQNIQGLMEAEKDAAELISQGLFLSLSSLLTKSMNPSRICRFANRERV